MKRITVRIGLSSVAVVFLLATAACGDVGSTGGSDQDGMPDTIVIGTPYDTSGDAAIASIGAAAQQGSDLALEKLTDEGFFGGSKLEVKYSDTKGSKEQTVQTIVDMTTSSPVNAVVGFNSTPSVLAAGPLLQDAKIPTLTTVPTGNGITEIGDFMFRVVRPLTEIYEQQDEAILSSLGVKTAAYMYQEDNETNKVQKEFRQQLAEASGIQTVADEQVTGDAIDFRRQLTAIKKANPDILFVHLGGELNLTFIKQYEQVGLTTQILGDSSWSLSELAETPAANCAIFVTNWSVESEQGSNPEFVEAYREKYGEDPNAYAAEAYDGLIVMATAIKEAGSVKSEDVRDALLGMKDFDGALGTYQFDEDRVPTQTGLVSQLVDGTATAWTSESTCAG